MKKNDLKIDAGNPSRIAFNVIAATICLFLLAPEGSVAHAKSMIVPTFEFYHTDNLNGATTSTQIDQNGTLVNVPDSSKPKSGNVYKGGIVWANAYSKSWGDKKFSVSPFLFSQADSGNYAPSKTVGGSLNLTLLNTAERKVTASLTVGRVMPKLTAARSNFSSVGLKFKQIIDQTQNITFEITSSSVDVITNSTSDPTNNSVSANYSKNLAKVKVGGSIKVTDRNSKTASLSGKDRNISLEAKYPMGRRDIYAKYSHTESSDDIKRPTQAVAREQTSRAYELGYSVPIPVTDLAKLTFYAKRLDANSNLALFKSETTTFGTKFTLSF